MKITDIKLENFRGISDLNIKLDEDLTVFYGINGVGKSSILDATAYLLSWLVNRIRRQGASGRHIQDYDIRNETAYSRITLEITNDRNSVVWSLFKSREGHAKASGRSELSELSDFANKIREEIANCNEQLNIPLFAYYPVNRAVLNIPLEIRKRSGFNLLNAYKGALESGASFKTFFEWFREREDLENENRRYLDKPGKPKDFQFPDRQLEAVRAALSALMPELSDFTIRRSTLRMEVEKNGTQLVVNQLSDGEKCLMAMVGDLARRLAIANPKRNNPLEGKGVILIDEIDLHLHPKWQRMLVLKLTKTFPNCQFIISTHSPHVLTHVKPENLFMLSVTERGLIAEHPAESYGKTVDRILEDLMGLETTRPKEIKEALSNVYKLIDSGDLNSARDSILKLEKQIGADPDLAKANVLIKRKELIGK